LAAGNQGPTATGFPPGSRQPRMGRFRDLHLLRCREPATGVFALVGNARGEAYAMGPALTGSRESAQGERWRAFRSRSRWRLRTWFGPSRRRYRCRRRELICRFPTFLSPGTALTSPDASCLMDLSSGFSHRSVISLNCWSDDRCDLSPDDQPGDAIVVTQVIAGGDEGLMTAWQDP
jgi:hypothetical protein